MKFRKAFVYIFFFELAEFLSTQLATEVTCELRSISGFMVSESDPVSAIFSVDFPSCKLGT